MTSGEAASFWDAVRAWADSAGLLIPTDPQDEGAAARPRVPQAVCDSCPICQAAATIDQVNPRVISDVTELARSLIVGLGSALTSAADLRTHGGGVGHAKPGQVSEEPEPPDSEQT